MTRHKRYDALSKALRENLLKRKTQIRGRKEDDAERKDSGALLKINDKEKQGGDTSELMDDDTSVASS